VRIISGNNPSFLRFPRITNRDSNIIVTNLSIYRDLHRSESDASQGQIPWKSDKGLFCKLSAFDGTIGKYEKVLYSKHT